MNETIGLAKKVAPNNSNKACANGALEDQTCREGGC